VCLVGAFFAEGLLAADRQLRSDAAEKRRLLLRRLWSSDEEDDDVDELEDDSLADFSDSDSDSDSSSLP